MTKRLIALIIISVILAACAPTNITQSGEPTNSAGTELPVTKEPTKQVPLATNTPIVTETPTEAPRLYLNASQKPGEWDLSNFSTEQQAWINLAMTDPHHAPIEAKNFYDQVRIEGIREQAGNQNITFEAYVEWLFVNGVHETGPLPFCWRKATLENVENLVPFNWNGQRGYLIEGYEAAGHDPNFGKPNQLFSSVERDSLISGIGGNISPLPDRTWFATTNELRERVGQNKTRDTIFGEPSFIIFPNDASLKGDLMGLTDIAGVDRNVAQEAIIRMFDERNGQMRYTIIRLQYQDQQIQQGNSSCETIHLDTSSVCPPGTIVHYSIISAWTDQMRQHQMNASRENMLKLFTFFTHPPFISLWGDVSDDFFIDGAFVTWDIKIPTTPEGYLP